MGLVTGRLAPQTGLEPVTRHYEGRIRKFRTHHSNALKYGPIGFPTRSEARQASHETSNRDHPGERPVTVANARNCDQALTKAGDRAGQQVAIAHEVACRTKGLRAALGLMTALSGSSSTGVLRRITAVH